MVSPAKILGVENSRGVGFPLSSSLKNPLMSRTCMKPLGDVQNTLTPVRLMTLKVQNHRNDPELKPTKSSEMKPLKCSELNDLQSLNLKQLKPVSAPLASVKTKDVEEFDPWSDTLAYNDNVPDTYGDIIPIRLQLSEDDINRLVMNMPGPRTGIDVNTNDYQIDLLPDFIDSPTLLKTCIEDELDRYADLLKYEDDIPPVLHPTFEDLNCDD